MATATASKPKLNRVEKYERDKSIAERCKTEFAADVATDAGLSAKTVLSICHAFGVTVLRKRRGRPQASRCLDIAGQRFDRLTAERLTDKRDYRHYAIWQCRCDCGEVVELSVRTLTANQTHRCPSCRASDARDPLAMQIVEMLLDGHTLKEAGDANGLTRERVRQKATQQRVLKVHLWANETDIVKWMAAAEAKGMKLGGYINSVLREATA